MTISARSLARWLRSEVTSPESKHPDVATGLISAGSETLAWARARGIGRIRDLSERSFGTSRDIRQTDDMTGRGAADRSRAHPRFVQRSRTGGEGCPAVARSRRSTRRGDRALAECSSIAGGVYSSGLPRNSLDHHCDASYLPVRHHPHTRLTHASVSTHQHDSIYKSSSIPHQLKATVITCQMRRRPPINLAGNVSWSDAEQRLRPHLIESPAATVDSCVRLPADRARKTYHFEPGWAWRPTLDPGIWVPAGIVISASRACVRGDVCVCPGCILAGETGYQSTTWIRTTYVVDPAG
ncbi:hypothetical protein BJY00DRAFT_72886 [Aspergillus carlsbadensis]|nr:hypothetical protein BJY00DRAFT_72886 [Aspergillus carlsbadensis]